MDKPKLIRVKPNVDEKSFLIEVVAVEGESDVVQADFRMSFKEMLQEVNPFCQCIIDNFTHVFTDLSVNPSPLLQNLV